MLLVNLIGCGMRQSQTGSLSSRIINANGDAVPNAQVFSIFKEAEKVVTAADGSFYLAELPKGLNNIVILHADYALEERPIEIRSDKTTVIESIRLDQANAPHKISDIIVEKVSSTTAVISWNTYRSVICNIEYGLNQDYGTIYREERPAEKHSAMLTGLTPETVYHFRVQYIDDKSISHYSYDFPFKTEMGDRPSQPLSVAVKPFTQLNSVDITWEAATAPSVIGYKVYRKEKDADWQQISDEIIPNKDLKFTDLNAESGSFYQYGVVSVNDRKAESLVKASEQYFIPGVINKNVWVSIDESPLKVTADLVIAAGTNFEVDPGVEIQIAENDSIGSGLDENRVEIIVHGRIALNGTEAQPVAFRPLDGSGKRDHWRGISILSDQTGISQLSHTNLFGCAGYALDIKAKNVKIADIGITYSENGISLSQVNTSLELTGCDFNEIASEAIFVDRCRKIVVSDARITEVKAGARVYTDNSEDVFEMKNTDIYALNSAITGTLGKSEIKNCLFVIPQGVAIEIDRTLNSRDNYIDHCTIDAKNGIVIKLGNITIENNIVINKTDEGVIGINNTSVLTPNYDFNNVYGFASSYVGCGPNLGGISIEPKFEGGNPYSYELRPGSSLLMQDKFGSEMGRYGQSRL
jgi:hypothetical protein